MAGMPDGLVLLLVWCESDVVRSLLPSMGVASMADVGGVAGATGRVVRWESRSPARLLLVDAVASPATTAHGHCWGARGGGPEGEEGSAGALHGDQV